MAYNCEVPQAELHHLLRVLSGMWSQPETRLTDMGEYVLRLYQWTDAALPW